jgi:putative transposase
MDLTKRRRHLPHWELHGAVYFLTFRSARGDLPEPARQPVIDTVLFDDRRKYDLYLGVIMSDHVHLVLQPLRKPQGTYHSLPEIMKTIKGISARKINVILQTTGTVWQEESFDRIIRDQHELDEKLGYMWNNPAKAGLVTDPADYPYFIWPPSPPQ